MKSPCERCGYYLLCRSNRICMAWFWWFSDRWRDVQETITEIAESVEWY